MTTITPFQYLATTIVIGGLAMTMGSTAHADDVEAINYTCDSTFTTEIFVDAQQTDWEQEVKPTNRVIQLVAGENRYDWTDGNDSSFKLWCRETENAIYFAVIGRDNILAGPGGGSQGDRFEIFVDVPQEDGSAQRFAVRVPVYPAKEDARTNMVWLQGGTPGQTVPAGRAEVVQRTYGQAPGFFIEMQIPRNAINSEFGPAPIGFSAVYRDIDRDQNREQEVGIATTPFNGQQPANMGTLTRGFIGAQIQAFRKDEDISDDEQPHHVHYKNVGGNKRDEYIAILDNHLIVIGGGFQSFELTSHPTEVLDSQRTLAIEFHDMDYDDDMEILHTIRFTRILEGGQSIIHQNIAGLYHVDSQGLNRFGFQEYSVDIEGVGEATGEPRFLERPKLLIAVFPKPRNSKLDKDNWINPEKGIDVEYSPMLRPWSDKRHILYYPMGNQWKSRTE